MATEEKLFAAVRLIKAYCEHKYFCPDCTLYDWCLCLFDADSKNQPCYWPNPEEGGVKVEKNICFECRYASEYPECPATSDDIVFASNGDTIVSCKAHEEVEGGSE